jgi:hypothetical protein
MVNKDNKGTIKKPKVKKVRRKVKQAFKETEERYREHKIKYTLEVITVVIFSIIMLLLLSNKTFFREEYRTDKITIRVPMMMYYVSDKDNEVVLKTLRKSAYVKDYFEKQFEGMTRYNCGDVGFYYDELNNTAIYGVKVDKKFAIKTVKIEYAYGDANCLCMSKKTGIEAEKSCQ